MYNSNMYTITPHAKGLAHTSYSALVYLCGLARACRTTSFGTSCCSFSCTLLMEVSEHTIIKGLQLIFTIKFQ